MKKLALLLLLTAACAPTDPDLARWEQRAQNVTITRDDWGIAHVRGATDADAVFGLIYAQAEDDFNRVETNFLNAMGRLAEAEGEEAIWRDTAPGGQWEEGGRLLKATTTLEALPHPGESETPAPRPAPLPPFRMNRASRRSR